MFVYAKAESGAGSDATSSEDRDCRKYREKSSKCSSQIWIKRSGTVERKAMVEYTTMTRAEGATFGRRPFLNTKERRRTTVFLGVICSKIKIPRDDVKQ